MSKVMKRNCQECLHGEVCRLKHTVEVVERDMGVKIEDCPHFLSGVNWVPEEDNQEDDGCICGSGTDCEYHGECPHTRTEHESEEPASDKRQVIRDIIMSALEETLKSTDSVKKMVVAPVDKEDIFKDLVSALYKVTASHGKPVSVTMTTPQLRGVLDGTPLTEDDLKGSELGMMFMGHRLVFKVNENITSAYISYKEGK